MNKFIKFSEIKDIKHPVACANKLYQNKDMIFEILDNIKPEDIKMLKWLIHNYPWTVGKDCLEMLNRYKRISELLHGD